MTHFILCVFLLAFLPTNSLANDQYWIVHDSGPVGDIEQQSAYSSGQIGDYGLFKIIINSKLPSHQIMSCSNSEYVKASSFVNTDTGWDVILTIAARTARTEPNTYDIIDVIVPAQYQIHFPRCDLDSYPTVIEAIILNVDRLPVAEQGYHKDVVVSERKNVARDIFPESFFRRPVVNDLYTLSVFALSRLYKTQTELRSDIRRLENQVAQQIEEIENLKLQLHRSRSGTQSSPQVRSDGNSPQRPVPRKAPPPRLQGVTYVCFCEMISAPGACNVSVGPHMSYPRGRAMCTGINGGGCDYDCAP